MSYAQLDKIDARMKPYQLKLDKFLADGGTVTQFAIAYPAETLILVGGVNAAIYVVCSDSRIRL